MLVSILSIDPGGTTGYCYAKIRENVVTLTPNEKRTTPGGLYELLQWFIDEDQGRGKSHVVYEDFQFRQGIRTGLDLTPAKLIGVIELCAESTSFVQFYVQQPSVQGDKAFFTNDRLKELDAYWPHGKGHARSATKHLLYWLKFGAGAQYVTDPMFAMEK